MKIYNYDSITKEYIGESEASLDIEATKAEGHNVYYLPANATFTKPPKTLKFEVAIYDNGWQKYEDFRGCWIVDEEMKPIVYDKIGELPDGFIYVTDAQAAKIQEDDLFYIIEDGQLIKNPNYAEQKKAREDARINNLTMTALDFLNVLKQCGFTDEQVEDYLNSHLSIKHQLQFCQNVYCGVAKSLMPIEYEGITITAEMVEIAFKNKHGEN